MYFVSVINTVLEQRGQRELKLFLYENVGVGVRTCTSITMKLNEKGLVLTNTLQ